jgi:hypothetical protein
MGRITTLRKDIKDAATKIVVSGYCLPVGDKEAVIKIIEALLQNDAYIFDVSKAV